VDNLADLQHKIVALAPAEQTDHAIRTLRCTARGFALLRAANGFQWSNDPDETFDWMIQFIDAGLRTAGGHRASGARRA
jgi:Tetracyclin repressor-like, C-terminal domain